VPAAKKKKVKCRQQLAECKSNLDKCMKILRWQTVDGKSYFASPEIPKLDFSSPMAVSTPFIVNNKQQTKRIKKAPKRYTPN
jgi:hypothetical protein